MAGQGAAMLTPFFWRNDLAEGRLVRPFEQLSTRGYAYWLAYPEHRRNVPKIKRFRAWLTAELARDQIGRAHVELQSLMRISYAVFCSTKNNQNQPQTSGKDHYRTPDIHTSHLYHPYTTQT